MSTGDEDQLHVFVRVCAFGHRRQALWELELFAPLVLRHEENTEDCSGHLSPTATLEKMDIEKNGHWNWSFELHTSHIFSAISLWTWRCVTPSGWKSYGGLIFTRMHISEGVIHEDVNLSGRNSQTFPFNRMSFNGDGLDTDQMDVNTLKKYFLHSVAPHVITNQLSV